MKIALALVVAATLSGCAVLYIPCMDGPGFFPPPPSVFCPFVGWGKKK